MRNDELKIICESAIDLDWEDGFSLTPSSVIKIATALLQRLEAEEAGYVLVPKDPDQRMIAAAFNVTRSEWSDPIGHFVSHYKAMLAASPQVRP